MDRFTSDVRHIRINYNLGIQKLDVKINLIQIPNPDFQGNIINLDDFSHQNFLIYFVYICVYLTITITLNRLKY